jgi:hypothetical protein
MEKKMKRKNRKQKNLFIRKIFENSEVYFGRVSSGRKKLRKKMIWSAKLIFIFCLVFSWLFSGWPMEVEAAITLQQEGFAFGDDNGDEVSHALDTQDANITSPVGTKTLRTILDATDDPESKAFKLKYQKNGNGGYADVHAVTSMTDQKKATSVGSELEYDTVQGNWNFSLRYDDTHLIHIWSGSGADGYIQIFEVASNGTVSKLGTALEFDTVNMVGASAVVFDTNKIIVQWAGSGSDGYLRTFQINTSTWAITAWGSEVEYDIINGTYPSIVAVDSNHFLCAWAGSGNDGYLQVAEVDLSTGAVTMQGAALEHDTTIGQWNNLFVLDATRFLLIYSGAGSDGFAKVFTVNTGTWVVTQTSSLEFDTGNATHVNATALDATHFLVAYEDNDSDGAARVLTVNTGTWAVTAEGSKAEFSESPLGFIAVQAIDEHNAFLQWEDETTSSGFWQTVYIDSSWNVSFAGSATEFDSSAVNAYNSVVRLTGVRVFASWAGLGADGYCRAYDFNPYELGITLSSNVASGGEATTARLTAPSGKTTSNFTTGRRWDDENGSDSIDITADYYTELEWVLTTQSPATNGDYFEFRVYDGDSALDTYTVTPKWTIGDAVIISISIDPDGLVSYGNVPVNSEKDTTASGTNETKTITNDGDVMIDLNIKTSHATGGTQWSVGSAPGSDVFVHSFSVNGGVSWEVLQTADFYEILATNISPGGTVDFDLKIGTPTVTSDYQQKTITVTVQAVGS